MKQTKAPGRGNGVGPVLKESTSPGPNQFGPIGRFAGVTVEPLLRS